MLETATLTDVYNVLLQLLYYTKYIYLFACGFVIYFIIKLFYNFLAHFVFSGV